MPRSPFGATRSAWPKCQYSPMSRPASPRQRGSDRRLPRARREIGLRAVQGGQRQGLASLSRRPRRLRVRTLCLVPGARDDYSTARDRHTSTPRSIESRS